MSRSPVYFEVSCAEVQAKLEGGDAVCLVDVRAPWEYERYHLPGALLLPLDELPSRFNEALDPSAQIICICEHGIRSKNAARFLAAHGFPAVATMAGGMSVYSGPVETGLPERTA